MTAPSSLTRPTGVPLRRRLGARLAVSLRCLGPQGCLPRSVAVVLLCRLSGAWPTWCAGVRVMPPFGAHAWVEADGVPVDENLPAQYFRPLMTA